MVGTPVLSLHTGGAIAFVQSAVIDPEDLHVIAYTLTGPYLKNNPDVGNILMTDDIREVSRSAETDDVTYSITGARVESPHKGVYIRNGKKEIK